MTFGSHLGSHGGTGVRLKGLALDSYQDLTYKGKLNAHPEFTKSQELTLFI